MSFELFKLHAKIHAGVQALGYTAPTPIQLQSIPPILRGRDVIGLAQTGTGKTAAFVLPILQRLIARPRGFVRALILGPTRELTEQTHGAVRSLGGRTGIRSASIYGGVSIQPQISTLRRGVEVVSACPGRLLDHLSRGTINLSHLEVLVVDEADQMLDMGFLPDITRIVRHLPTQRQTLLFSATMSPGIMTLAREILQNPVNLKVGETAPPATVSHTFYPVETERKTALLKTLLKTTATGPVLIFTRTKMRAKRLAVQLEQSGYDATAIHGDLSQNRRQTAMDGFRRGRYKILVATDVAARGIDVSGISHVINYDIPDTLDAYTHRVGRTGRASNTGKAFTFVAGKDKELARSITKILGATITYGKAEVLQTARPLRARKPLQQRDRTRRVHARLILSRS